MSICTVSLIRGRTEVEVQATSLTTERISRVFKLDPATVWLKEEFGSRAFFPEADGVFDPQHIVAFSGSLKVEGIPLDESTSSSPSAAVLTVPVASLSAYSPVPRPVIGHRRPKEQTFTVKVVQAHFSYSPTGKPIFEKIGQMFISIGESTSNVAYILSSAQAEFGADHVLVTSDGLQLHNTPGTQGLKFWKTPNRKIYAVPEEDLAKASSCSKKRVRAPSPEPGFADKIDALVVDVTSIKEQLHGINQNIKDTKVLASLIKAIEDTFKCKSCRGVTLPPVVFAKCC